MMDWNTSLDAIEPEIKEYLDFLNDGDSAGEYIITKERIDKNFDKLGNALNTLLVYPDLLMDLITPPDSHFRLGFDQRMVLRSFSRHRQIYFVATRGASKSFLAFLSRYLTAMSLPGHWTFVCADVKTQARDIADQTVVNDLWVKFPFLKNEMKTRMVNGKRMSPFKNSADDVAFYFTGGGSFSVVGIDSARGKRKHSGIIEEMIEQDPLKLNEKIIPLMNIARRSARGQLNPHEPHAAQIYITSAGFTGTFAYDKFIETMCLTAIDPDNYCVLSMDWHMPVHFGRLDPQVVRNALASPTYDKESFAREFGSVWSDKIEGAAFTTSALADMRKVKRAELRAYITDPKEFYMVVADMAKDGAADTAVLIMKVKPRDNSFLYTAVNAFTIATTDYSKVSNILKATVQKYNARLMVYDANGIGASLRDWINRPSHDEFGNYLPGLGIINPPKEAEKDLTKYSRDETIVYEIKASSEMNNKINRLFFGRLHSGAVRMLIPFREAREIYESKPEFHKKKPKEQQKLLLPYQMMDKVHEQLRNLKVVEVSEASGSTALKVARINNAIQKDFYSCFSYGVYVAHNEFEMQYYKKDKKKSLSKFALYSG